MSNSAALLRLLEPAVRPGGLPGASKPVSPPLEARDFESLLAEATAVDGLGETNGNRPAKDSTGSNVMSDMVRKLAQFDRIDNAALRNLVADATRAAADSPKAGE